MSVTVYTGTLCASCNQLKNYLKYKGITFTEKSITDDKNLAEAFRLSGSSTVPVTVINDKVILGYNLRAITEALTSVKLA